MTTYDKVWFEFYSKKLKDSDFDFPVAIWKKLNTT